MIAKRSISEIFPQYLFWDMDYNALDIEKDKDIIIPRALFATTSETFSSDISKLEKLYRQDQIIEVLKDTKERISNKICSMVANRYHIAQFSRFVK